jgi:hypothetical protein
LLFIRTYFVSHIPNPGDECMLNVSGLKLIRKLSVLCVLTIGLFFAVSVNQNASSASFCCSTCIPDYEKCQGECLYHFPQNPARYQQCVELNCDPELSYCQINCYPFC